MREAVLILSFITAIPGMVRYKRLSMPVKIISIYLVFYFLDTLANTYSNPIIKNNVILTNIEALANYIFFSLVYYLLFRNKKLKLFILVSIAVYTIFLVINGIFWQPFNQIVFPSAPLVAGAVLLMVLAVMLFNQMLLYPLQVKINRQSVFWFNMAIFFFSTLMFLNFALINYYAHRHTRSELIGYFWHFMDISLSVLLAVAVLTDNKETSTTNV